jgi:hypothetical protein
MEVSCDVPALPHRIHQLQAPLKLGFTFRIGERIAAIDMTSSAFWFLVMCGMHAPKLGHPGSTGSASPAFYGN